MSEQQGRPKLHIEGDWKSEVEAEKQRHAGEKAGGGAAAEQPGLHIDSDWKAQAQAEKERLAQQEQQRERDRPHAGDRGLPEPSFRSLVSMLASQAIMGLGAMTDPQTGGVMIDLEGARFSIDLLAVLEEKTKGNIEEEESRELTQILAELRNRCVQVETLLARQAAKEKG